MQQISGSFHFQNGNGMIRKNGNLTFEWNFYSNSIRQSYYGYCCELGIAFSAWRAGHRSPAAVVHLNFWAGSTFSVPVCTVPGSIDKVDAVRRYALNRLNLLLLKGQRSVWMYWKLDSRRRRTSMDFTEGNEFIWLHVRNSKLFWFLKRSYYWTINLRWNLHLFGVHDLEWIL